MPHAGNIGAERGAAKLIKRRDNRTRQDRRNDRFQRRQDTLTVGLPERHEPHAGRDKRGGLRMQIGRKRRFKRDRVAGAGHGNRHRQGNFRD